MKLTHLSIACSAPADSPDYLPEVNADAMAMYNEYLRRRHIPDVLTAEVLALSTVMTRMEDVRVIARKNSKRILLHLTGHGGLSILNGKKEWFFYLGTPTKEAVLWWPVILAWMQACAADGIQVAIVIDSCHAGKAGRKAGSAQDGIGRIKSVHVFNDQSDIPWDLSDDPRLPKGCLFIGACKGRQYAYGALNSVYTIPKGNGLTDTEGMSLFTHAFCGTMMRGVAAPQKVVNQAQATTRHLILGRAPGLYTPADVPDMVIRSRGWTGEII